ncbi:MAG TPA: hypothetical protein VFJ62_07480 [Usitatibacter sp.]|nr:hypothetical protein [Usitatibacter sp.]
MKEIEVNATPDISGGQASPNVGSPIMISYPILPVPLPIDSQPVAVQPIENRILFIPQEPLP